jgi:hypothetical protein
MRLLFRRDEKTSFSQLFLTAIGRYQKLIVQLDRSPEA